MFSAGIDGTRTGWVVVVWDGATLSALQASSLSEAMMRLEHVDAVGIDMPIGLLDAAEHGGRACERLARMALPGRTASVFSSPVRGALAADDYSTASQTNRASSSHAIGLSKQSYALFPKLREVERLMRGDFQHRIFEVHPELCFSMMASEAGFDGERLPSKKTHEGSRRRLELLTIAGLFEASALAAQSRTFGAKPDDVIDACVAAWTAHRKIQGIARRFPESPERDSRGLFMEMWA